jgi:hypothetical protein
LPNVYTISSPGTAFIQDKCMLGLFNGIGSGKVLRIYKVYVLNAQTAVLTGLNNILEIWRFSTGSGGLAVQIIKHDTQSPAPPSQIIASTGMSYTKNSLLRRIIWSSDEPVSSDAAGIDEIQTLPAFCNLLDYTMSYTNSTVEPIILRPGYGIGVVLQGAYNVGALATPVGSCDLFIEYTMEAT